MAKILKKPVFELKKILPTHEVYLWMVYLESEPNRYEKLDYYLAQIAMAIYLSAPGKKPSRRLKDFLIKFRTGGRKIHSSEEAMRRTMSWVKAMSGIASRKSKDKRHKKRK